MDKATGAKAVIAEGAHFKGQIKNARALEINGVVEADLKAEKVTIGTGGKFLGAINADLVVISGTYEGTMDAGSIWATASARIAGKIQYKTLQMDRGAALNCRVVHNWKPDKQPSKKKKNNASTSNDQLDAAATLVDEPVNKASRATDVSEKKSEEIPANSATKDAALKIFGNRGPDEIKPEDKPTRKRRLGIFGFGAKA